MPVKNESPLAVIWRRKLIILSTFLLVVGSTAVLSKTLEKIYSTSSKLLVALQSDTQTFNTVQASQAIARSYAVVIDSPNIANLVAADLGGGTRGKDVRGATSFETIPQTQLLKITAEDPDPRRAQQIADAYATVFRDHAEANLSENTQATIAIADSAPLPSTPSRPRPTLYVMVAAILGLALGLVLAFLRERLDRRLRSSEDVEASFDVPVLGRIPRRGRSETSVAAFREASRILRTNLQFASPGGPLRSIAITSGREGEGKTTTVAQLAVASAEIGLRVIVVEGDLRRPALQKELMPDHPEPLRPGLSNYLVEAASLHDIIYPTGRPGIYFVPAGPLPPSPSALLESRRARTAVREIAGEADLVLVDCPPLNIGADASVVAGWVDGVIIVVDLQTSTDQSVRGALRQLEAVQGPTLGLVLNRDRGADVSRYDYYGPVDGQPDRARAAEKV